MKKRKIRVIFDTNVWISFLIGKSLSNLKIHILDSTVSIIITEQLLIEIKSVTGRDKLKKYFFKEKVEELIEFLEIVAENVKISPTHFFLSRDPKDDFLLDLIDFSRADYLVTGDKDLLTLNPFKTAHILSPSEFEDLLNKK